MAMYSLFAPVAPDTEIEQGAIIQAFRDTAAKQGVTLPAELKPYVSIECGMRGVRVDVETARPCPRS